MSEHMRPPLARVLGRGSAKSGTEHFWRQRLTAVANIPLTIAAMAILITLLPVTGTAPMTMLRWHNSTFLV